MSIEHDGPALTGTLRLTGASKSSPGRLTGTVTNSGSETVRQLRAQIPEGQALLADSLAPGMTMTVDAPVLPVTSNAGGPSSDAKASPKLLAPTPEDTATFAVASGAMTGPGQVALVGATGPATGGDKAEHRVTVVVALVGLKGADNMAAGTGGSILVAASNFLTGGDAFAVFDATAPAGASPLSLRYPAQLSAPGQSPPPSSVEVYNWTTGAWRSLPPTLPRPAAWVDAPVDDAEVNQGLVRVRDIGRLAPGAQLLLRSTSDEDEAFLSKIQQQNAAAASALAPH